MRTLDISFNLFHRYEQLEKVENYFGLLAIFALCQTAYEDKNQVMIDYSKSILNQYPDNIGNVHFNFDCYRVGGNGKAWLALMNEFGGQQDILREYAEKTLVAPVSINGILKMPSANDKDLIWIDVVTAITPFMLYVGKLLNEQKYIDFAARQCFLMYETFLDSKCGLLHQCCGFIGEGDRFSEDHWSRGNGWGYLGLAELVQHLPKDSAHREKAEKYFVDLTNSILLYQTKKGLWRQELTEKLSWEESSGSGLISYCLGIGIRLGLLSGEQYKDVYKKSIQGILSYCINLDFTTNLSCPGCLCPGEGDKRGTIEAYITEKLPEKNEHHSFGCLMLALTEAHRNGIVDASLKK